MHGIRQQGRLQAWVVYHMPALRAARGRCRCPHALLPDHKSLGWKSGLTSGCCCTCRRAFHHVYAVRWRQAHCDNVRAQRNPLQLLFSRGMFMIKVI